MKVDGSEGFQAHVEVMCAPLGELVGAFQALRERRSFLPDANSEAMRELSEQSKYAGAWGDEPSALAHNLAHLQLAAAEDCIEAVIALVRGPRAAVFSPIVLARAALECCGRARWLAEPGIGTKYRVARGMSEHLYSLFELGRLPGKDEQAKAAQRRLLETAKELRFEKRSAKGQKVVALEGPRPSQREAIRTVLSDDSAEGLGEVLWRYSSATAHGTAWALVQSLDPVASGPTRQARGVLRASSREANVLLATLAVGYASAGQTLCRLLGWDDQRWEDAAGEALRAVGKVASGPDHVKKARRHELILDA